MYKSQPRAENTIVSILLIDRSIDRFAATMPRYTDGFDWFHCVGYGGAHFTVTAAGKIAVVELCSDPVVIDPVGDVVECGERTVLEVTELESESSVYDQSTETWLHLFDVYLGDSPATFSAFVSGRRIRGIARLG